MNIIQIKMIRQFLNKNFSPVNSPINSPVNSPNNSEIDITTKDDKIDTEELKFKLILAGFGEDQKTKRKGRRGRK
jgi:hypothetical protein